MGKESLYRQVTQATLDAQHLEVKDPRSKETQAAYAKVSDLEQQIAGLKDTSAVERNIGRRGSVTAAIMAGNLERAKILVQIYEDEPEFTKEINQQMRLYVANPDLVYELKNN